MGDEVEQEPVDEGERGLLLLGGMTKPTRSRSAPKIFVKLPVSHRFGSWRRVHAGSSENSRNVWSTRRVRPASCQGAASAGSTRVPSGLRGAENATRSAPDGVTTLRKPTARAVSGIGGYSSRGAKIRGVRPVRRAVARAR